MGVIAFTRPPGDRDEEVFNTVRMKAFNKGKSKKTVMKTLPKPPWEKRNES